MCANIKKLSPSFFRLESSTDPIIEGEFEPIKHGISTVLEDVSAMMAKSSVYKKEGLATFLDSDIMDALADEIEILEGTSPLFSYVSKDVLLRSSEEYIKNKSYKIRMPLRAFRVSFKERNIINEILIRDIYVRSGTKQELVHRTKGSVLRAIQQFNNKHGTDYHRNELTEEFISFYEDIKWGDNETLCKICLTIGWAEHVKVIISEDDLAIAGIAETPEMLYSLIKERHHTNLLKSMGKCNILEFKDERLKNIIFQVLKIIVSIVVVIIADIANIMGDGI